MQYCIIAFIFLLNIVFHPSDYVYVNHIYDRPGYLTCERVPSNDPCLADQVCEIEKMCPGSDGLCTDCAAYQRLIADQTASGTY